MVERLRRNRRSQGQRANRNGRRPRVEQLERRDLLATFSYSEVYAEATLTDFASGVSEVVRLRGTATGAYSDSVGSLALEDKSQQLLTLSLDGFDAKQFGAIHVSLNQASLSTGRIVERRNDVVGQLELPATSQFDVDFQAQITTYNGTVPQVVTVRPDSPVRIEVGIGELPVGINDTFRLRSGSVNLSATPGSPIISLSDLALTFRPLFAKIEGQKFQDTNANGVRDPGETGINGWLIAAVDLNGAQQSIAAAQLTHDIDLNGDQVIDPETESGLYVFDGLAPGDYFATELLQPGWTQTAPGSTVGAIPPTSGPGNGWVSDIAAQRGTWHAAALVGIDWPDDGNLDGQADEQVFLGSHDGSARLGWQASSASVLGGPLDQARAEISNFHLAGDSSHGGLVLSGGDGTLDFGTTGLDTSLGRFRQIPGDPTHVAGSFDLDFSLRVGAVDSQGGVVLQPTTPLVVSTKLDRLPVDGFVFSAGSPSNLVDDQSQTVARIVNFQWVFYQSLTVDNTFGYEVPLSLGRNFSNANFGNVDQPNGPFGFDYGDAPDSFATPQYPTYLAHDGARHAVSGRLYLGTSVDADDDGIADDQALGDDLVYQSFYFPVDDEDGVAFHGPAVAGQAMTVDVTASRAGKLNAWVDFNHDGDWADVGEQVFTNVSLAAGVNSLSFNVPANATTGVTTMTRFRLNSAGNLSYTGLAADGEVEDHALAVRATSGPNRDFGDAINAPPYVYPTQLINGGASHLIDGHYLGNFVDGETDGAPSGDFQGDDQSGVLDDEDGVQVITSLVLGQTGSIAVNASLSGYLNAWIDFNQDGDWNDPNEHVFDAQQIDAGMNLLDVRVPSAADGAIGSLQTAARFRFTASPLEGRTPGGAAQSGEVEDYVLPVLHPVVFLSSGPWNLAVGPTMSDRNLDHPGVLGLTTSPNERDALDNRFSQLAEQSFYYRIGSTGGEQSLNSLRLTNVSVDYGASSMVVEYGDLAFGDPIHVLIRYTLSSSDLMSVTLDEQVLITNQTFQPLDLTWFVMTDVDLNGAFGDHDQGRVDLIDSYVQVGQFGSSFQQLVTSPPLPDAYQVDSPNILHATLNDPSPTQLANTPALGTSSSSGDVAAALQWNLPLGITQDDRTTLLNLSKVFTILPVVNPDGSLLTSPGAGQGLGGSVGGPGTATGGGGGGSGGGGGGGGAGGGTSPPVACRGLCVLDPAVAIGYDYVATTSNTFASVQLPYGFGDDSYIVQTPNGLGGWNNHTVHAGDIYSFQTEFPTGLSHFRVLGIELTAAVNPLDPIGFPTVVQFINQTAEWNVRMTGVPDRVFVDPLGDFTEEVNIDVFGQVEVGDMVTYHKGRPDEETGLLFGQTAFRTRAEALASLQANGFEGLTQIIETTADMGDAPATYPTLVSDGGPAHGLGSNLRLGSNVDADPDGQPTTGATGDDVAGTDDEDGVEFLNNWTLTGAAQVRVTASAAGILSAWVDWNNDGDWSDAGEQVFTNRALVAGANNLSFTVPANAAITSATYSRFRFSSASNLQPTGPAPDGEVEDYAVAVSARPELRGRTYADINSNSRRDAGEPFLNGWTVELVDGSNQVVRSTTTADVDLNGDNSIDPNTERGVYRFLDVPAGTYQVREVTPGDWTLTAPDYGAMMTASQIVPSPLTAANGFGAFGWDAATNTLSFTVDFDGLTGSTNSLKLYDGAAGTNGVEIRDLSAAAGVTAGFTGPVRGSVSLTSSEAAKLAAGSLYVSLLTTAFPSGELRGQIGAATTHRVTLGTNQSLEGLDFGNQSATPRTSVYPASQGQVVVQLPGGAHETIPLVGSSTMQMFLGSDGSTGDSDLNGKDDASLELSALALRGFASLGRVDVSLRTAARTFGRVEETTNNTAGKLDLPPFTSTGSATSYLDVFFQVTITNGASVQVYHTASAARVTGTVTSDPTALGETLTGTGSLELLDSSNAGTGIFLIGQSYTPSPLRPWHNIVRRLDIDNSGQVVPLDALLVINELNSPSYSTANALPAPVDPAKPPPPYFDVTANGSIEPLDALLVINFLNGNSSGEGELAATADDPAAADLGVGGAVPGGSLTTTEYPGAATTSSVGPGVSGEAAAGGTTSSKLRGVLADAAWLAADGESWWDELPGAADRDGGNGGDGLAGESPWSTAVDRLLAVAR